MMAVAGASIPAVLHFFRIHHGAVRAVEGRDLSASSAATPCSPGARRAAELVSAAPGLGWWRGTAADLASDTKSIAARLADLKRPLYFVRTKSGIAVSAEGSAHLGQVDLADRSGGDFAAGDFIADDFAAAERMPLAAYCPALSVQGLGDPAFLADHGVRAAYMAGSMANGIASCELVEAIAREGLLASFGAAGLTIAEVTRAIDRLAALGDAPYAFNLIHSPNEPAHEAAVVDLYLKRGVRTVEASAYLDLTLPVVRYRLHGIGVDAAGNVVAPNRIIAKASRVEVATRWLKPAPARFVAELVRSGELTAQQADLATHLPMADDLTAEADSGGHTDNRPAITLLPTMIALRDRLQREQNYRVAPRIGAAGGIATPASAAAAFAMGAAYVVTGSINQACIESGASDLVRTMLAAAEQADVIMAPAADMFEMGVKLQVLRRGTMFAMRAAKLYELYRTHDSLDALSAADRAALEKTVFRAPLEQIWQFTQQFFFERDPAQIERAASDAKHKMALVFRWYLGLSSAWANRGDAARQVDYQVWCGPAMGAFNEWTRGTPLAAVENRRVATVAWNIMVGAALATRIAIVRSQGVELSAAETEIRPRLMAELAEHLP
jgi:PfaD family protein